MQKHLCIGNQVIIIKYGNCGDRESMGCYRNTHQEHLTRYGGGDWGRLPGRSHTSAEP